MKSPVEIAKYLARRAKSTVRSVLLAYPKRVQCNCCGWSGRRFLSDPWHKNVNCPKCRSGIRQRLFFAALQNIANFSFERIIHNKKILNFAPEDIVSANISDKAGQYSTADFMRTDCDFQLDISNMPEIENGTFDVIIAFDVLEHVLDYQKALDEAHRILTANGFAILTVPQKDNLSVTYEDSTIVTPEDRTKHFGQWDHLRIFGDDFSGIVEKKGFTVVTVDEAMFSEQQVRKHVLFPPELSKHPLVTNHRKVFFCQKTA